MIVPQLSLNTFAAWKARLSRVPVREVPVVGVPVPGCYVCPALGRDPSSNAARCAAFDRRQAQSCCTRLLATLRSQIIPGSAPPAQFYPTFCWCSSFSIECCSFSREMAETSKAWGEKKRRKVGKPRCLQSKPHVGNGLSWPLPRCPLGCQRRQPCQTSHRGQLAELSST